MSRELMERPEGVQHSRAATADTNLVSVVAAAVAPGSGIATMPRYISDLLIYNNTAAAKYIKFYNKATAPVIASDAALILLRIILPASGHIPLSSVCGLGPFSAGIAYCITGAVGDADATATAANDVMMNLRYF